MAAVLDTVGILVIIVVLESAIIFGITINGLAAKGKSFKDLKFQSDVIQHEWDLLRRNSLEFIKILLFGVVFIFSLYLGITFLQVNSTISSTLMGNLSASDRSIGEGLAALIGPTIGIFFGIAFAMATLIFEALTGIDTNEKMFEMNQNLKAINDNINKINKKLHEDEHD